MHRLHERIAALFVAVTLTILLFIPSSSAQTSSLHGRITDARTGKGIPGATVVIVSTMNGAAAQSDGRYRIRGLSPGRLVVRASALGYRESTKEIVVPAAADVSLDFGLTEQAVGLSGVEVSALRPTLEPQDDLSARKVRESHAPEAGALMRALPGLNAARRGAVGLDPNIRGLVETEVGAYIDGVRFFPAGPLRMDSQISHFDPTSIKRIEVVKGPYALTWGAGNLSAIRVERIDADHFGRGLGGFIQSGYNTNLNSVETAGSASGHAGRLAVWTHGAFRQGNDYQDGAGETVAAGYQSAELRGKVGYHTGGGRISVSGGYNRQDDIDYPGRLLDATYFDAVDVAAQFRKFDAVGLVRGIDANVYWNGVRHAMNNEDKPTRQAGAFPNGMSRPPLIIEVIARTRNLGGRAALDLRPIGDVELRVGGDFYRANRDAHRPLFAVMPDGTRMVPPFYESDQVWPDVTILDAGQFVQATVSQDRTTLSATVRTDFVQSSAGSPSDAYLEVIGVEAASDLDASEVNLSGAVTASRRLDSGWSVAAGLGSVVRTADALERYSDRVPASKAQTSAEFVGNPDLKPERATQIDLWLDGVVGPASVGVSLFGRRMDNYITLEPTDIPKLLPLSPDVVFRYVNGEATFVGAEGSVSVPATDRLTLGISGSWLRGQDTSLDEPALGVSPWKVNVTARQSWPSKRVFVEGTVSMTGEQDRVAVTRGERPTPGYTVIDIRTGWSIHGGFALLAGVNNLADAEVVNHLNASNPFTGAPLPEPGRVVFSSLRYSF